MAVGDKLVTLDGLKAVYQDLNGNIVDLKGAVKATGIGRHPLTLNYSAGVYSPTTGGGSSNNAITVGGETLSGRYGVRGAVGPYLKAVETDSTIYPFLLGTNSGTYAGWWDGTGFVKTGFVAGPHTLDVESVMKAYPGYTFKMAFFDVEATSAVDVAETLEKITFIYQDRNLFDGLYLPDSNYEKPAIVAREFIDSATGINTTTSANKYARTVLFDPGKNVAVGISGSTYYFSVLEYGADADITDGTGFIGRLEHWTDQTMILNNSTEKIAINIQRKDGSNIQNNTAEKNAIRDALVFYRMTDDTLSKSGVPADAKAVSDELTSVDNRLTSVETLAYNRLATLPPSYYTDHLDSKIETIKEKMQTAGQNSFTFAFITDIHWGFNEKKSPSLMRYIMDRVPVNDVICGGDIIDQGEKAEMLDEVYDCINAFKLAGITFPVVIGNHDHNWNITNGQREITPSRRFTDGEVWASMEAQYDKYQRVFWDGEFNYYIDYPESNTRVIVINTGDTDADNKLQWDNYKNFCDTLVASADKHIIVISHGLNESNIGAKLTRLCYAFNNRVNFTENYYSQGEAYLTYDYNFSEISETKTGNVYAIIGGHNHTDSVYTVSGLDGQKPSGQEENNPYFPYITRTTDSRHVSENAVPQPVPGTVTEQAFDIVTISYDVSTPKVSFVRIGRGDDLEYSPTIPDHS